MVPSDQASPTALPHLVLVSGAPGTGKTTLAHTLSQALSFPLLSKDTIRQIMLDAFKIQSWEASKTISVPVFLIYYGVIAHLLEVGISVIADCNFHRGVSEHDLRPLTAKAHTCLIHCQTTHEISTQRFIERSRHPDRRNASMDAERLAQIASGEFEVSWSAYDEPMHLDVPLLIVDMSVGYAPGTDAIMDFIRSARSASTHAR